jgi:hypothetical protein
VNRSPARPASPHDLESPHDIAARWVREGLDEEPAIKPDAWKASALQRLGLRALSYAGRMLTGEQHMPLGAIIATTPDHPRVTEHVARKLAALVGKVLADEPRVTDVLNDVAAFASLGASSGRVLDVVGRAIEDGIITPEERADMIAALEALGERVHSLLVRLRSTERERVEGVRTGSPRLVKPETTR